MSMFRPAEVQCPECGLRTEVRAFDSVNGDRRPDLREAILEDHFMRIECPACGEPLRLKPRLVYFDQALGLWVNARPVEELERWAEVEEETLAAFVQSFGPFAAPAVQRLGAAMRARVSFGWAGLREKLLCARHGVDEVSLEALKAALLRDTGGAGLHDEAQLRLVAVDEDRLVLGWFGADMEAPLSALELPRARLAAVEGEAWAPLRAAVQGDCFIDMNRTLREEAAPA
ncbi:MAG: hypothetical protein H6741_01285 [Alphaproteobacteria bacterium]|nr:hypothetical protein [Alphaproteobacteria bacterium]